MYSLEKYHGPGSRHACPHCGKKRVFTLYVNDAGECLPDHVGRCDREVKCGYHYTAKQFLTENGQEYVPPVFEKKAEKVSYVSPATMERTQTYTGNILVEWLHGIYGDATYEVCKKYHVGTARHWPGSTVFWQVDREAQIRSGKIMLYDAAGHRVKKPFPHVTWVHKLLEDEFTYSGCLFGEHLLPYHKGKVAVVESEKTAIIAAICDDEYLWLATGGLQMMNIDRLSVLRNYNTTLFPDAGAFEKWREKAQKLREAGISVTVSHKIESYPEGYDIADVYLEENRPAIGFVPLWKSIKVNDKSLERDWFTNPWNPEKDSFEDIPQCWDALLIRQ